MAIHYRENQYRGINAHLHSFLQNKSGAWRGFHTDMIGAMRLAIDSALPVGYYALTDQSLQLDEYALLGSITPQRTTTIADVAVYERNFPMPTLNPAVVARPPTTLIPLVETLTDEDYLNTVMILKTGEDDTLTPVTRIELLSPANKPSGSHYSQYMLNRDKTLLSGVKLVEIDYLHQIRSPIRTLPSYPRQEKDAYPYLILVSDLLPNLEESRMAVYGINVDEPIPTVRIPLAGQDYFVFDFNALYQQVFAQNRYYGEVIVDYEQLPVKFDTYSSQDQARIQSRMEAVAERQKTD